MNVRVTDERIVRLFLSAPADGSQDFYLSVMAGLPVPVAARERVRIQRSMRVDGRRPAGEVRR